MQYDTKVVFKDTSRVPELSFLKRCSALVLKDFKEIFSHIEEIMTKIKTIYKFSVCDQ